jgi:ABC-type transport system involved in multi-copper enzyme maturation permease subunit
MPEPTRRQKLRPIEYVMLSGAMALFAGLVVLMVTRDATVSIIASGLVFIVVIIGIAMLLLAVSPNSTPDGEKSETGTGND